MTLSDCVLFPQAAMPLHIFEPRYREMLKDTLEGERIFAIAGLNDEVEGEAGFFEPPFTTATVGMIRVCHHNTDGTSDLILQGLARVKVERIVQENPYRIIEISALHTFAGADLSVLRRLKDTITTLLEERQRLIDEPNDSFLRFVRDIDDPEVFLDLCVFTTCQETLVKQELLENLNTLKRYRRFARWLVKQNKQIRLYKRVQGKLKDSDIGLN